MGRVLVDHHQPGAAGAQNIGVIQHAQDFGRPIPVEGGIRIDVLFRRHLARLWRLRRRIIQEQRLCAGWKLRIRCRFRCRRFRRLLKFTDRRRRKTRHRRRRNGRNRAGRRRFRFNRRLLLHRRRFRRHNGGGYCKLLLLSVPDGIGDLGAVQHQMEGNLTGKRQIFRLIIQVIHFAGALQCFGDRGGHRPADRVFMLEPHLPFRRMDVHIHLLRRHFKVQDHRRETARLIQRRISFADAAVERRGFDRAAVDERALLLARIACEAR